MPNRPPTCVIDTNIIIDLFIGGVLDVLGSFPAQLLVPDVILAEIRDPGPGVLADLPLQVCDLSSDQVEAVMTLRSRHRKVSTNDLFAFVLAQHCGATLLTGDRNLRDLATQQGLDVHGTLWVLDKSVELQLFAGQAAIRALKRMMSDHRTRLPVSECRKYIERWACYS